MVWGRAICFLKKKLDLPVDGYEGVLLLGGVFSLNVTDFISAMHVFFLKCFYGCFYLHMSEKLCYLVVYKLFCIFCLLQNVKYHWYRKFMVLVHIFWVSLTHILSFDWSLPLANSILFHFACSGWTFHSFLST